MDCKYLYSGHCRFIVGVGSVWCDDGGFNYKQSNKGDNKWLI